MANPNSWTTLILLCLALAACSNADLSDDGAALMRDALADARVENERHAEGCDAAPSMDEMMGELERHELVMDRVMARMGDARAEMGRGRSMMGMHCSGRALEHMSETLDSVPAAMSAHDARMHAAQSLDEARSECGVHTDGMAEMMQSMTTDLDSMPCGR